MPGPTLSKNTADFELLLGGRYLLESVTPGTQPDGYLLEDGSGVLLLDCVTPSLGDPVTFTNPAWSGRVVSVSQRPIVEGVLKNYKSVVVTATNQTADPGGTAPGDFSDVPAGGYYLQEDGIGKLILEDSSGDYLLEGTSFAYRELSVRNSQNQDGTTTAYGSLVTFEGGFAAGQTFLLTSNDLNYAAQSFTITNVTIDFIGAGTLTPRYRIEFGDTYTTMQTAGAGILTRTAATASTQLGVVTPGGVLGYASVTADQAAITAQVDLTGLSVTVTVGAGRRIRISTFVSMSVATIDKQVQVFIVESAANLLRSDATSAIAAAPIPMSPSLVLSPTAGVHTYKLQASSNDTATLRATLALACYIMVEDIGT